MNHRGHFTYKPLEKVSMEVIGKTGSKVHKVHFCQLENITLIARKLSYPSLLNTAQKNRRVFWKKTMPELERGRAVCLELVVVKENYENYSCRNNQPADQRIPKYGAGFFDVPSYESYSEGNTNCSGNVNNHITDIPTTRGKKPIRAKNIGICLQKPQSGEGQNDADRNDHSQIVRAGLRKLKYHITLTARAFGEGGKRIVSLEHPAPHRTHSPQKNEHNTDPHCCESCPKSGFCFQKLFKTLGNGQRDTDSETDQHDYAIYANQTFDESPKRDKEDQNQSNYANSFDETHHIAILAPETCTSNTGNHFDCAGFRGRRKKQGFRVSQSDGEILTLLTALCNQQTASNGVGRYRLGERRYQPILRMSQSIGGELSIRSLKEAHPTGTPVYKYRTNRHFPHGEKPTG